MKLIIATILTCNFMFSAVAVALADQPATASISNAPVVKYYSDKDSRAVTNKPDAQPERPRTIREAQINQLPSLQMQQVGGGQRRSEHASFQATPFNDYDHRVIDAISQRWYALLDTQKFASTNTGKVTVAFQLKSDGTVTDVTITTNTVGEQLGAVCKSAIEQAAPFAKWPDDMAHSIGTDSRAITNTFYYY